MNNENLTSEEAKKITVDDLFKKLSTSKDGLKTSDVEKRRAEYGFNELPEKKAHPFLKFLGYFWGPIPWMIEIAAVLSAVIKHWEDFVIILILLLVNAVVGFWQENKADNAIEMLKKKLALKARVLRDQKWISIHSRELIPGDIVRVRLGDVVPADVKLFDGDYLLVDESALTGESLPVEKHASEVAYSGSIIKQGEMNAVVTEIGINSYFGKTTKLVAEAKKRSHFQKAVVKIGDYLIALAVTLVAIVFLGAMFRHEMLLETLQFALVLIVAAIPVALPAVLTVTMAVGATGLAKKEAIVSKLTSIEEMAGVDVLCSDKTGTITKNELTFAESVSFNDFSEKDVLFMSVLASREEDQDPIDNAIIIKAKESKDIEKNLSNFKIIDFKPFDPVIKRTEASVEDEKGNKFKVSKGAPQVILSLISKNKDISKNIDENVNSFASKGYRALGIAKTDSNGKWEYVGLIGLYDPPRDDSAETIKNAQDMGVTVKMVTGDHVAIAKEISKQVGLKTNITTASDFLDKSDKVAQQTVENADGFAQVFPEHKYHIVELLQDKDHIVGMTGDGVNDAPALKKSDVGIAVSGATDAAKSAADIVFTKPGLSTIVDALKESRKIFQRMNNYAIYRIAETIRVLLLVTFAILIFSFYPVTAIMIVILAMLNDIPIMMIAYDNVKVQDKPVRWNMREVLSIATLLGTTGLFFSFGLFLIGLRVLHLDQATLQTLIFLKLAVAGHMTIYLARTGQHHFWKRPYPALSLLLTAEITQVAGTIIAVYGIVMAPIGWALAGFIWGYALIEFVVTDFIKIYIFKLINHKEILFHRKTGKIAETNQ
ncbi:MAG: plasma-membrane proton-efflux P-type ATPase [Thermoplasmata archaeon M9B2D]|nr:MAG: plasma-membrane proton-efflux P-type ATPase [Thermoplasmata archaeon M9B2D]